MDIFHCKCWFSEAKDDASDFHVEHFRPKLKVEKLKSKIPSFSEEERTTWGASEKENNDEGYWWLAFDWTNYLISGSKINSSYKRNYFPLKKGSFIAYKNSVNIYNENVILLNPTIKEDSELIDFNENGMVIPKINDSDNYWKNIRTVVSINVYGLNKIESLKKGRKTIWKECYDVIKKTNEKYEKSLYSDSDELLKELANDFSYFSNKLKEKIDIKSRYSAVAMACLNSCGYEWINDFILM